MQNLKRAFWIIFALTMSIYLVMLFWSLPRLNSSVAGPVFDLRMTGYSLDEARSFLLTLSPQDTIFYMNVQHLLDTAYPALLATSLGLAIFILAPASWGHWRFALAAIAIPGMVFDYLENMAVRAMLATGPETLTQELVQQASGHTLLKAQLTTAAMLVLVALLVLWLRSRHKNRKTA